MNASGLYTLLGFIPLVLHRSTGHAMNPRGVYTLLGLIARVYTSLEGTR